MKDRVRLRFLILLGSYTSIQSLMSDAHLKMPLVYDHQEAASLMAEPGTGLPPGISDVIKFPQPVFTPSLYRETHNVDHPLGYAQLSASPTQMSAQQNTSQQHLKHSIASHWDVFLYILKKTCSWVLVGIIIMLLGIGLLRGVIFPHIYTCPESAKCSWSFDPEQGNTRQLLQTFTIYWLRVGLIVSSVGLLKLTSYQAWFILMHQGNSVKNLDLSLGAIRGIIYDAALLLVKKNNHILSVFVFALLGISAALTLIVGLSIDTAPGVQTIMFQYNATSQLPDSSLKTLGNDGHLAATERMLSWILNDDQSHSGALKGTLVTPDGRSSQGRNILPGGPTITAWFICEGLTNYTLKPADLDEAGWYIWVRGETRYTALPTMSLAVSLYRVDTAVASYVWVSNTTGLIPNATTTADGRMHMAFCTHFFEMVPEEPRKPGVQYLEPTQPRTSGCGSADPNVCVADSVNNALLNFWGGTGLAFWSMSCRSGMLGITAPSSDAERYCPVTQELFQATAGGILDAIMQTAPTSVVAVQELEANVRGLDQSRWWLNATIPAATLVLYVIGLTYTCMVSRGDTTLKELNLFEVVRAVQTNHVQDLVSSGRLEKTPLLYYDGIEFVDGGRNVSGNRMAST
jgi:hypothetical protein